MDVSDVQDILKQIEEQLASIENLDPVAEQSIQALLNLIERLVAAQQELLQQVQRLKEQLENKKKKTTTAADNDADKKSNQDHSSEKERKNLQPPPAPRADRRSFKEVSIHQETEMLDACQPFFDLLVHRKRPWPNHIQHVTTERASVTNICIFSR